MAGIRPAEFWELTWSELAVFVKASERLEWQRWRRTAQLASWTTAPHLKRPYLPTALFLIGANRNRSKRPTPNALNRH
jgi:hypothetical protein